MSDDSEVGGNLLGEDHAPHATLDSARREVQRLIDRDRSRSRRLRRITLTCIAIASLNPFLLLALRATGGANGEVGLTILLLVGMLATIAAIPVGLLTGILWLLSARSADSSEIRARLVELEALVRRSGSA